MPGALTHIGVGLVVALIVHLYHFKLEYSLAVFSGSLLPDTLKFGLTATKQLTWKIFYVEQDAFFTTVADITNNPGNWLIAGIFVVSTMILLYHFHVIKKKTMKEYDELYLFILGGVMVHLILDGLIQEQGPWL